MIANNSGVSIDISKFDGKKIFITGGTGFFGKSILDYLIINQIIPQKITILTRNITKFITQYPELTSQNWLDFKECDVRELTWNNQQYDYFIHAATSVVNQDRADILFDEIVYGTRSALEFAKLADVACFINISSGAVYETNLQKVGLTENSPLLNNMQSERNTYGLAKIAAEHLAYIYSQQTKMKVITLRCFCFAGKYLDTGHFAIGEFVKKALNGINIEVKAGGGIYRSYMSTNDLVLQILQLLILTETVNSKYEVYNIGSDKSISLPDLAQMVVEIVGGETVVTTPNLTSKQIDYYVPNVDKINKLLNHYDYLGLENMVQEITDFIKPIIK